MLPSIFFNSHAQSSIIWMQPKKVIIIGSGVAGLASAVRLAAKGFQVSVFERNSYPGGKLSWFKQDGFSFDAGPSLFTQPQFIEDLFLCAGKNINDYLSYEKVPISCSYFFEFLEFLFRTLSVQKFCPQSCQSRTTETLASLLQSVLSCRFHLWHFSFAWLWSVRRSSVLSLKRFVHLAFSAVCFCEIHSCLLSSDARHLWSLVKRVSEFLCKRS